jgi:hypothetical protein
LIRSIDHSLRVSAAGATLPAVIALQDLWKRMPLLVFILLAIACLVLLGLACACATDHPRQNIDRALGAIPAAPPLVEVWTFAFGALLVLFGVDLRRRRAENETSRALLQSFLF